MNCIMYGFPDPSAMTSSNEQVACEDNAMHIFASAATLEVPISPSGWAILWEAAGENPKGKETLVLQIVVEVSRLETSRRTRGRIL